MPATDPIEISFVLNSKELTEDFKRIASGAKNPDDAIAKLKERFTQLNAAQLLGVKGMEDVVSGMKNISTQAKSAKIEDIGISKENIEIQKQVIAELEDQLNQLQKTIGNTAPGNAKSTLLKEARELETELASEKQALSELEIELNKNATSHKSLASQVRALLEEMRQLELQGKKNTDKYEALKNKAAELDEIRKRTRRSLQGENADMRALTSGISAFAGGLSAAQGAMGLFADENENLQKIMLRVQSLMAVSYGLQQVSEALDERSAFSVTFLAKAKEVFARANTKVATSLHISNTAAKALLGTLTLGLAVAIPVVISLFEKWNNKAIENAKLQEDIAKKTADALVEPMVAYRKLQKEWEALNGNLEAQKKLVADNVDVFKDLGVEVNNVSDAEEVIKDETGNFVKSMEFRAKAAAAAQLATEKFKEALDKQAELEADKKMAKDGNWWQKIWYNRFNDFQGSGTFHKEAEDEIENLKKLFDDLMEDSIKFNSLSEEAFKNSGLKELRENEEKKRNVQKQSIQDLISDREKAWSQYYQYEAEFGRKAAQRQFSGIKSEADSFFDWLSKQKASLSDIVIEGGTLTDEQIEQMQAFTDKLNELGGKKTDFENFSKGIDTALERAPLLADQLAIVNREIEKLQNDSQNIDNGKLGLLFAKKEEIQDELSQQAQDFIAAHQSIEQQKIAITQKYAAIRKEIEARGDLSDTERSRLIEATRQEAEIEIEETNRKYAEMENVFLGYSRNIMSFTRQEVKARIRALGEYLKAAKGSLTDEEMAFLETQIKKTKALESATDLGVREKQLLQEKKRLLDRIAKAAEEGKSANPEDLDNLTRVNKELSNSTFDKAKKVAEYAGAAADGFFQMASAIGDSNEGLSSTLETLSDIMGVAEDAANAVAGFASGDIVSGIGSTLSAVAGVFSIGSKARASEKAAAEEMKKRQDEIFQAGLDYNKMLRDQLTAELKINEAYRSRVEMLKEAMDVSAKNLISVEENMRSVLNRLLESETVVGQHTKKYGGFLGIGRKTKVVNDYETIANLLNIPRSEIMNLGEELFDELARINSVHPLTDDAKQAYEQLLALKEEYGDLNALQRENSAALKDAITGTTVENIKNSIAQGLMEGKKSFADFADDIEGIIRKGILSGMEARVIEPEVQKLQDALAEFLGDGVFDADERLQFQEMYMRVADEAREYMDLMNQAGIDISQDIGGANSMQGAYKAASQESIDLLAGNTAALRLSIMDGNTISKNGFAGMLEQMARMEAVQMDIENNTRRTAENTSKTYRSVDKLGENFDKQRRALEAAGIIK